MCKCAALHHGEVSSYTIRGLLLPLSTLSPHYVPRTVNEASTARSDSCILLCSWIPSCGCLHGIYPSPASLALGFGQGRTVFGLLRSFGQACAPPGRSWSPQAQSNIPQGGGWALLPATGRTFPRQVQSEPSGLCCPLCSGPRHPGF